MPAKNRPSTAADIKSGNRLSVIGNRLSRNLLVALSLTLLLVACDQNSEITAEQVRMLEGDGLIEEIIILDVRTEGEYSTGHLPESICIPVSSLEQRISELDPSKPIIVYCKSGCNRGEKAAEILKRHGFKAKNMTGGIDAWQKIGGKVEGEGRQGETKMCPGWELGHGCED